MSDTPELPTRDELLAEARGLNIVGRDAMTKDELAEAIADANDANDDDEHDDEPDPEAPPTAAGAYRAFTDAHLDHVIAPTEHTHRRMVHAAQRVRAFEQQAGEPG